MEDKLNGYTLKHYPFPTKRYCQTLELKDDSELIAEYRKAHSPACFWPEIGEGIKSVGILGMDIFISGNRLFMIVETKVDFNWDEAFARLATLPRQAEWEAFVGRFQVAADGAKSDEKWHLMDLMFRLPE